MAAVSSNSDVLSWVLPRDAKSRMMGSDFSRRCAEPAVEMVGVGKAYGPNARFRGVNLAVRRGGCAALIGRNGVGKTTLLRIAAGLTAPTEGTVRRSLNLSIGYVPENLPRLPMTARQFLRHMAAIEGLGEEDEAEGRRLITDFSLDDLMDLPMKRLSKGTLQKVAVMQAFLRRRDLLILDEPLSGQDEKSREVFLDRVLQMRRAAQPCFSPATRRFWWIGWLPRRMRFPGTG